MSMIGIIIEHSWETQNSKVMNNLSVQKWKENFMGAGKNKKKKKKEEGFFSLLGI